MKLALGFGKVTGNKWRSKLLKYFLNIEDIHVTLMIITEFHEPLVIIGDYKFDAFWHPYRIAKRLYPLSKIVLIGEVKDKSIDDVLKLLPKNYRGSTSAVAFWYFISRYKI